MPSSHRVLASKRSEEGWYDDLQIMASPDLNSPINTTIFATQSGGILSNYDAENEDINISDKHDLVDIWNSEFNDTTKIVLDENAPLNEIRVGRRGGVAGESYNVYTEGSNPGDDTFVVSGAFWELDGLQIDGGKKSGGSSFLGGDGYDVYKIDASSNNFTLYANDKSDSYGYKYLETSLSYEGPESSERISMQLFGVEEIVFSDLTLKISDLTDGKDLTNNTEIWEGLKTYYLPKSSWVLGALRADNTWNGELAFHVIVDLNEPVNATAYLTSSGGKISGYGSDGRDVSISNKHDLVRIDNSAFNDFTQVVLDQNAPLNQILVGNNYSVYDKGANPGDDTLAISGAFWELDLIHIDGNFKSGSSNFFGGDGYDVFKIDKSSANFTLSALDRRDSDVGYEYLETYLYYDGPETNETNRFWMNLYGVEEIVFSDTTLKISDLIDGKDLTNQSTTLWAGNKTYQLDTYGTYKLFKDGQELTLTDKRGRTFSDRSSRFWDAVSAVESSMGFQVLLEGNNGRRAGRYNVLSTNHAGVITRSSGWKRGDQMLALGYEDTFGRDFNGDGITGEPPATDDDGDGLIDGSITYKLFNRQNGQAITLTNSRGRTFSDRSSHLWNITKVFAANPSTTGFQVLVEGQRGRRVGRYQVWSTDASGVITQNSGWKTGEQMLALGYEDTFGQDLNGDGFTGLPPGFDEDADGLVDGSNTYKLFKDGQAIPLTDSRGRAFSDRSSRWWDAVQAVQTDTGFQVLLEGNRGRRSGRFLVLTTDAAGVITHNSGWKTGQQMFDLGYEGIFNRDFDGDNLVSGRINGSDNADTIYGTELSDEIYGLAGNDIISGGNGDDLLNGGPGNDSISGGTGNDIIDGLENDDFLIGGPGDDTIYGRQGNDIIDGGEGNDNIYGGPGTNTTKGGAGDDIIFSYNGSDEIDGGDGNDTINAGDADHTINGGAGADILTGGSGVDLFIQNDGDAIRYTAQNAFSGNALVTAGTFTFGNSVDRITDFTGGPGGDLIDVVTAGVITILSAGDSINELIAGNNYLIRGDFIDNTALFTQSNVGNDALILIDAKNASLDDLSNDNYLIVEGAGATLVAANFV